MLHLASRVVFGSETNKVTNWLFFFNPTWLKAQKPKIDISTFPLYLAIVFKFIVTVPKTVFTVKGNVNIKVSSKGW